MNAMGDPTENQGATYSQGMGGEPLGPTGKSHAALNDQPQRVSGALWLLTATGKNKPRLEFGYTNHWLSGSPCKSPTTGFHPGMGTTKECT